MGAGDGVGRGCGVGGGYGEAARVVGGECGAEVGAAEPVGFGEQDCGGAGADGAESDGRDRFAGWTVCVCGESDGRHDQRGGCGAEGGGVDD